MREPITAVIVEKFLEFASTLNVNFGTRLICSPSFWAPLLGRQRRQRAKIHAIYGLHDKAEASSGKAPPYDCFDPNVSLTMKDECVIVKDYDIVNWTRAKAPSSAEDYCILLPIEF
jgi:hypothetical protein